MPIDPRIALGVQPLQMPLPDPNQGMNALARMMQIKSAMQEGDMNALKIQELQRGVEDANKLNTIYGGAVGPDGSIDRNKLFGGLATQNLGSKIPGIQKQLLDADTAAAILKKTQTETQKAELEMGMKKAQHVASILDLAKDPVSYATVRAVIKNQFGQDLPEQFDPGYIAAERAKGQTLTERLSAEHQRLTLAETGRHNVAVEGETARHNKSAEGIQVRGQNMVDARSREANAQGKTQIVETPQGFVIVDKNSGTSRPAIGADGQPLKGKANDRVMTDAQAKANLFGTRMKESDRILTSLEGKYMPAAVNAKMAAGEVPIVGGVAGYAGNLMLSESGQQAEQAQRDFINAVLRRESGAVISPAEFANGQKQYFPQPGDSKALIQQKARNRALAISGMEAEVPGGFRVSPSLTSTGQTGGATGDFGGGWSIQKVN